MGHKVLSSPDKLLADRAKELKKIWTTGANMIGELRSSLRRMAIKEAEERMPTTLENLRKACQKAARCLKLGHRLLVAERVAGATE